MEKHICIVLNEAEIIQIKEKFLKFLRKNSQFFLKKWHMKAFWNAFLLDENVKEEEKIYKEYLFFRSWYHEHEEQLDFDFFDNIFLDFIAANSNEIEANNKSNWVKIFLKNWKILYSPIAVLITVFWAAFFQKILANKWNSQEHNFNFLTDKNNFRWNWGIELHIIINTSFVILLISIVALIAICIFKRNFFKKSKRGKNEK
ncbi:hypothetical protein [Mycoplasma procyoni]|uniref:hypothetical protein n=1 Tax=Mycoplasma procyoni TaxID=568784 RepID=UPI00197BB22B|nr:hypothetical protein [Mycoplasma procyoni]MBN3535090.1 hypothetical protein [Mycoplasma procyoni]